MTYTSDARAIRQLTLDSADAAANKSNRIGFAIMLDSDDPESIDIVPLGASKASVREFTQEELAVWNNPGPKAKRPEESDDPTKLGGNAKMAVAPFEQLAGANFQRAAAQSHEVARKVGPTPTQKLTGGALRAKQTADAARERLARMEGQKRNEAIAQRQKQFWQDQEKRSA